MIVIPAYNEEGSLKQVIGSLRQEAGEYDILVVDDGSLDDTGKIAKECGVRLVSHGVNLGLWEAVRTGMNYAVSHDYSYVIQFDADGQHDAFAVSRMLEAAKTSGDEIVIGSRYPETVNVLSLRRIGGRIISACIKLTTGVTIKDPTSGMRLYSRRVAAFFSTSYNYTPEPDTIAYLARKGVHISEMPVEMHKRTSGSSYLDITESVRYMFHMCTSILLLPWIR